MQTIINALNERWKSAVSPLQIACVAFPALLFSGLAWIDYQFESQRIRDEVVTTTGALAEHAQTVVETTELVIARVIEHIAGQDWATLGTSRETHDFLARLRQELPQVESVFLVDPDGINVASSRVWPMPRFDVSTREYFAGPLTRDSDRIVISAPFESKLSGQIGFTISRRRMRDGVFDGIVAVTVSQSYFGSFYRTILIHAGQSAAGVVRLDGTLLVRFPDPPRQAVALPSSNPMLIAAARGEDVAVFNGRSDLDGVGRIGGFRRLHGVPLLVGYSINRTVLLSTWGAHAAIMAACALLLSLLLLITERAMRRRTAIEHESLRRLVEETERRRQAEAMAQQSQKMEALGRLTGGVAHDFNNLLAVILGSLELARRRDDNPRTAPLLRAAAEAAGRGAKLTAQMLAFARKQEVAPRSIDVNAVIRGMDDLLRRTLGPSVRLRYDLAEEVWPVLADFTQLELVLLNLAVNARDAMPGGGGLTFRTSMVAAADADGESAPNDRGPNDLGPGDHVCIQVADDGVGMPEDVRNRAHEPFFTTKAAGSGTGLGLSMVYGFARELGGALRLQSDPGHGTTVSLFLRRAEGPPLVDTPEQARAAAPMGPGRVLLVDDDPGVRQSVRDMLEELGHEVVDVAGGADALECLTQDQRFDVLVFDFAMPLMNGAQLAEAVTQRWPTAPILFVTGYVENDALRPWSDRGYGTVRKPFDTNDLAEAVGRAMRRMEPAAG